MIRMDDILEMIAITSKASCIIADFKILRKLQGYERRLFENYQLSLEYTKINKQKFFDYKKLFDISTIVTAYLRSLFESVQL